MRPSDEMPVKLIDALYFISEMSKDNNTDNLIKMANEHNISTNQNNFTNSDLATSIWLENPELLESLHAKTVIKRTRSFQSFSGRGQSKFTKSYSHLLPKIEDEFNEWFYHNNRGKGCKILTFEENGKLNFLIRHGMPFKREGCMKNDKPDTIFYRPEAHDLLYYDTVEDVLAINNSIVKKVKLFIS